MSQDLFAPRIIRDIQRPAKKDLDALAAFGAATVHEASQRGRVMQGVTNRCPGAAIAGAAVTSLNRTGDNLMIHAAVEICKPGDVLVVAVTTPGDYGMFGELLATLCAARGIQGVILDSGLRDSASVRKMGFPVWSRTVTVSGTTKLHPGSVNVPVVCGNVVVNPGDAVVADDDGVVVVDRESVPEVVERGTKREAREAKVRERFRAGELSLDVSGLRERLEHIRVE